jgi:hypothetical protein
MWGILNLECELYHGEKREILNAMAALPRICSAIDDSPAWE